MPNSMPNSLQEDLFGEPTDNITSPRSVPVFQLTIPGRLASWNEILGMEQWARYKYKQDLADVFLSTLRATARDSSIRTTSAANTLLTYADTLESYLAMRREQRRLKSLSKRLARKRQNARPLKSFNSKVPF